MLRRAPLGAVCLACLSCGSRTPPTSAGSELSRLPAAGAGPLVGLLPGQARFAVAFRDARAAWLALRASPLVAELERAGVLDDLPAVPLVERWEALRGRLAELARLPLPPLTDLLAGPAVLAWVDRAEGSPGGWLWVERLGPESRSALGFARALNTIRSSASEVEVDVRGGVSLRHVRLGPAVELTYYVIADRLVLGTERALVSRSLDLALGEPTTPPLPFPKLEAEAAQDGVAADWLPADGGANPPLPGVRRMHVSGHALTADLDPALWGQPERSLPTSTQELLSLAAPGLDLPKAWAAFRPRPAPGSPAGAIAADVDRLAQTLGRGAFFSTRRTASGEVVLSLVLAASSDGSSALRRLLADSLQGTPTPTQEPMGLGGSLFCPWGDDGPFCLAACPSELAVASRGSGLASCGALTTATGQAPVLSLRVTDGEGAELLRSQLSQGEHGFRGEWAARTSP